MQGFYHVSCTCITTFDTIKGGNPLLENVHKFQLIKRYRGEKKCTINDAFKGKKVLSQHLKDIGKKV